MKLYLASGNAHKAAEFQALAVASRLPLEIVSAREVGGMPPVEEDTGTFLGNARKKARALQAMLPANAWVLADDSGVCVDALGGAPGVESAYYAGPQGDAAANLAKLVEAMRGVADDKRGAHFLCVLFLLTGSGEEIAVQAQVDGHLLRVPQGGAGFGYDPLFVPRGFTKSYAEISDAEKNRLSHRARAFAKLAERLGAGQF